MKKILTMITKKISYTCAILMLITNSIHSMTPTAALTKAQQEFTATLQASSFDTSTQTALQLFFTTQAQQLIAAYNSGITNDDVDLDRLTKFLEQLTIFQNQFIAMQAKASTKSSSQELVRDVTDRATAKTTLTEVQVTAQNIADSIIPKPVTEPKTHVQSQQEQTHDKRESILLRPFTGNAVVYACAKCALTSAEQCADKSYRALCWLQLANPWTRHRLVSTGTQAFIQSENGQRIAQAVTFSSILGMLINRSPQDNQQPAQTNLSAQPEPTATASAAEPEKNEQDCSNPLESMINSSTVFGSQGVKLSRRK